MKLLIIDDNQPLAEGLVAYFEDVGVEGVIADSAEKAKILFLQQPFDGAIVDFYLPGADGVRWVQWALEKKPNFRWVLYTGSLSYNLSKRLQGVGLSDRWVFRKPKACADDLLAALSIGMK
ncbi:MAG: hypothetical protein A2600_11200 [Candidatus Lambdaproteobacteria bacterium RIFOXYD1_FULL_56_27]|uniref:Response regulatory domain-containing protein n=1 Tax=Candidatus Lambdaproteobacteria bacterium RIFOXYD2_FULL_56_26 TaxID=1817773 RepID=A0A1F6GU51_9PROT|nr:MAG: hypothetical protein A2426_09240 [Candidatus Lambdaproteobacteria bacterium RIFOXYC1_FULL_56_13]OGH01726.1 MAG: hypothetical protein A2557_09125 [Candidatus Lambdaproteobacteria bacterium RIFOXYD2_FULL_56_26]OGH07611.1 MAG: hypothetical protein A2600_11200 [Candidatus Lambdaproteobacteria bacterium RIFOXYD1_FULL_56_27]